MAPFPAIYNAFNSASLWASTEDDLRRLYYSPNTGAVTTRTAASSSLGFPHDEDKHQHAFFTPDSTKALPRIPTLDSGTTHPVSQPGLDMRSVSTLNTLGYSPLPLKAIVSLIRRIQAERDGPHKPVIFSVAGDSAKVFDCFVLLANAHDPSHRPWEKWCIEINLSCPNIPGAPPLAYSATGLARLLQFLTENVKASVIREKVQLEKSGLASNDISKRLMRWNIPIGIKLPPYTYSDQFNQLVEAIREANATSGSGSKLIYEAGKIKVDGILDDVRFATALGIHAATARSTPLDTAIDPALLAAPGGDDIDSTLAFDLGAALSLDDALKQAPSIERSHELWRILTPPFPISFVTSTNTLGSCLHLSESQDDSYDSQQWHPTLNSADGLGVGGLAGASLHPLSLGNVMNLKTRLGRSEHTRSVKVIGVGGVKDAAGFARMKSVGADAVALATALGAKGCAVFDEIAEGLADDKMSTGK